MCKLYVERLWFRLQIVLLYNSAVWFSDYTVPKGILEGEMFLCIWRKIWRVLWKCFITSNFLTSLVKIIVVTANISLLIFHLWCGKVLLLSYNRSEIFPNNNGKNRSETFPHMFGFHSYISFLVWKFLITFGPLGQCTFKNRWLSHTIVIL